MSVGRYVNDEASLPSPNRMFMFRRTRKKKKNEGLSVVIRVHYSRVHNSRMISRGSWLAEAAV